MRSYSILFVVCVALLASSVKSQVRFTCNTPPQLPIAWWSPSLFCTTPVAPTAQTTITITPSDPSVQVNPSTLTYGPDSASASYKIWSPTTTTVQLTFTVSDPTVPLIPTQNVFTSLRTIVSDQIGLLTYDRPSEPLKISIVYASAYDLTLTPSVADSSIIISPNPVIIPAGQVCASYTILVPSVETTTQLVTWTVSGQEQQLYSNMSTGSISVPQTQPVYCITYSANALAGTNSTQGYCWSNGYVNDTVSITPSAADTVFQPPTLTLSPGTNFANFTYISSTIGANKQVLYDLEPAASIYATPLPGTLNVPYRTVTTIYPNTFLFNTNTSITIRIGAPTPSDLVVFFCAANVQFFPPNVTFSGSTTSWVVTVWPFAIGSDTFSYLLGGDDAPLYSGPLPTKSITIGQGSFISPYNWYVPTLWVGITSDSIPVRVNVAPLTNVSLIPVSADLVFNPPSLTFRADSLQQYFTITPAATSTSADTPIVSSPTVNWIVTGGDAAIFSAPAVFPVTVYRRSIQFSWSAHIDTNGNSKTLYINKQYIVWVTANYVGPQDSVWVIPTSPYVTFSPSVLNFTSGNLQIALSVTPNAAIGATSIDYILGGNQGSMYNLYGLGLSSTPTATPVATSQPITISLRPISFSSALISPDNRVLGAVVSNPTVIQLAQNNVWQFSVNSSIIPDKSLVITPVSKHIDFSPSGYNLNANVDTTYNQTRQISTGYTFIVPNLWVNVTFSVSARSPGVHEVWWQLSGDDAEYYIPPPHMFLSFTEVTRPLSEVRSGSVRVEVTSVFVMLAVALAFFL